MRFSVSVHAVDSHTMGEPTRVVVGGVIVPGETMSAKKVYLEKEKDELRQALMLEPRGHDDMFGSIITQPTNPAADFGIIFMHGGGYLNMCGHGTIGATTIVLETGMKMPVGQEESVVFDTPAGLVKARAKMKFDKVESVTFENVPAFVFEQNVELEVPELGKVTLDIAFGGSFFALISSKELGVGVHRSNTQQLIQRSMKLMEYLNKNISVQHPINSHIRSIDLVEVYEETSNPKANMKNAVIFGNGQVDRSPCGTGTCAKMALLYQQGKLAQNESFVYESILGTMFTGRVVGETKVGNYSAIVPEITGSAFITGFNQYVIDPEDPLKHGFSLRST